MTDFLVADIGGTNARFALVTTSDKDGDGPAINSQKIYKCADFNGVDSLLESYRDFVGGVIPELACIAIAGPVDGKNMQMTNLDWAVSREHMERQFGFRRFTMINDFAAVAYALVSVGSASLQPIKAGRAVANAPRAVIGPGSGLGVAALIPIENEWYPLATESGHAAITSATDLEAEVIGMVKKRHPHVSAERMLAGNGIIRIHRILAVINGTEVEKLSCEQITDQALQDNDASCSETIAVYTGLLAGFTRDVAFYYGARGGITFAGNIMRHIAPLLSKNNFESRFMTRGVMDDFISNIPVSLMTITEPGLLGAAAWAAHQNKLSGA
jgi:glucokinase